MNVKMYLRSNGALPISVSALTSFNVVSVTTSVHQLISAPLCGIFHYLKLDLEVETHSLIKS